MSRSGYCDGIDEWDLIRWRGAVASAIRGRRGQAFLCEMLEALDALPEPILIEGQLIQEPGLQIKGGVCAIGSVGVKRGLDMTEIEAHDPENVGAAFGIARAMAAEIEFINDEACWYAETPEGRFRRVRAWVVEQIEVTS